MAVVVTIENGFVEVGCGSWLMGCGQPAAFFGTAERRRRKGLFVRDRSRLDLVVTTGAAKCADASRPFLTHIPCAEPISAVSGKVLAAPEAARSGAQTVKVVPFSLASSLVVTEFGRRAESSDAEKRDAGESDAAWVVMATASRTARVRVADGDTFAVRPEAVVAWTGKRPTGFCQKLGLWDFILPRMPRDLMLHFHGPCLVWIEGAKPESRKLRAGRGGYGV